MGDPSRAETQGCSGSCQRPSELLRTYVRDPQSPRPDEIQRLIAELEVRQTELEVQVQKLQVWCKAQFIRPFTIRPSSERRWTRPRPAATSRFIRRRKVNGEGILTRYFLLALGIPDGLQAPGFERDDARLSAETAKSQFRGIGTIGRQRCRNHHRALLSEDLQGADVG